MTKVCEGQRRVDVPLPRGGFSREYSGVLPVMKRLIKPGMGFFSFETAWRTLQGYEAMPMLRKGQIQGGQKADSSSQTMFIAKLFGMAA
jgi:hypothetical protein